MTVQDTTRSPRYSEDAIDVAPGVPTDRVRWPAILAGTFAALTALAILGTLGAAIGLSSFDRGEDDPRNFAMAGGIWGLISTILAFGLGGWLAARAAALRGRENGMLNGALVAAVGIPLMMFLFGSAATAMSSAELSNNRDAQARGVQSDSAMTASARVGDATGGTAAASGGGNGRSAQANDDAERGRRAGARTAWGTLIGMVLAVGASAFAGHIGARSDGDDHRQHRRGNRDNRSAA